MFNFNFDFSKSFAAMQSLVKQSYDWGQPIDGFVKTGAITANAYKEITGQDYGQSNASPVEEKQPANESTETAGDDHDQAND
ncbi:XkdX family protein [uncultured Lactobacillus sp.]|uniref:XkdX family protein n=1 Tax=uncultured Lactobacillus sp. TaxID=153152 RepID=UPI00262EA060|nr:XkdX family protein [uncultured Lactobacillus sp.]